MVALVVLVESRLGRHVLDYSTVWSAAWSNARVSAQRETRNRGLLFFGDSLVMHGVVPEVVSQETGETAFNLGLFKGLPAASLTLLRAAFAAGARPEAVLIDGELLQDSPGELVRLWPELLSLRDIAELGWLARDLRLGTELAVGKILGSLRQRYEIREAVMAGFAGQAHAPRFGLRKQIQAWGRHSGAHLAAADARVDSGAVAKLVEGNYWPNSWMIHPVNREYVERFLALAESGGARVYWLIPPIHPEVQRRRDGGGLSAAYDAYLRSLQERHRGLVVIDARHAGFPEEAMMDLTHLNRQGAVAYSVLLGRALRAASAERWVALGRYTGEVEMLARGSLEAMEERTANGAALRR